MLANRPIPSVAPRTGFVQAHVTRASDPQLTLTGGLRAPISRFEGAQRALYWPVQGARGPPIEKVVRTLLMSIESTPYNAASTDSLAGPLAGSREIDDVPEH
jgi:hypothetical protein